MEKRIRAQIEAEQEPQSIEEEKEAVVARLLRKIAALRQRRIANGEIEEAQKLDIFFEDDDDDEDRPCPASDENGQDRAKSGEDWTDPEPLSDRPEEAPREQEPRISAENRPGQPRITFF